ncbi:MAG: hypothetical protein CMH83_08685 [Nocardioides sp.]|nr:hypothetical protein [Nocardioides sp.]
MVSHGGAGDACDQVAALQRGTDQSWRVVVVENSGDAVERGRLRSLGAGEARVAVVEAPVNAGYFGGARLGLEAAQPLQEWVVVANADLLPSPTFVERLLSVSPDAVVAPSILSGRSGRDQNPYLVERPGRATRERWRWQTRWTPVARFGPPVQHALRRLGGGRDTGGTSPAREIYAPHGSCIAFPPAYFAHGGDLAHGAFLFGEEITVGETCRRIGVPVRHEPSVVIRHAEHGTTGVWRSSALLVAQRDAVRMVTRLMDTNDSS